MSTVGVDSRSCSSIVQAPCGCFLVNRSTASSASLMESASGQGVPSASIVMTVTLHWVSMGSASKVRHSARLAANRLCSLPASVETLSERNAAPLRWRLPPAITAPPCILPQGAGQPSAAVLRDCTVISVARGADDRMASNVHLRLNVEALSVRRGQRQASIPHRTRAAT